MRRHLGVERLHLFGHGWGGLLAQLYASALPRRVAGLFLADPAPGVGLEWVWARRHEAHARRACRRLGRQRLALWSTLVHLHEELGGDPAARRLSRLVWTAWFAEPSQAPRPDKEWLAGARSRPMVAARHAFRAANTPSLPPVLPAPWPVLVLYGEHGLYGDAARQTVCDRFAGGRHVLLKGAGTCPGWRRPAAFDESCARFYGLERLCGGPAPDLLTPAAADRRDRADDTVDQAAA